MHVSSSRFYSGQSHVNFQPNKNNNKTLNNALSSNKQEPFKTHELRDNKSKTHELDVFSNGKNTVKEKQSYFNKQALNQYQYLQTLEKREYAQNALGFSVYA